MITSPNNETLKEIRKLAGRKWRDKLTRFVAEGEDLLAAADAAGWVPVARLAAASRSSPSATNSRSLSRHLRPASLRISLSWSLLGLVMVI